MLLNVPGAQSIGTFTNAIKWLERARGPLLFPFLFTAGPQLTFITYRDHTESAKIDISIACGTVDAADG